MQLQHQYSNIISHVLCRTTVSFINEKDFGRVLIVLMMTDFMAAFSVHKRKC
jgi:hypothetical protein